MRARGLAGVSGTNGSRGGFPTLPLRTQAALRHRHSQYAPRTQQQKIVGERSAEKRELETSLIAPSDHTHRPTEEANMADSEKLDNQRLKNFKNKGRDLEVKVPRIASARRRFNH